MLIAATDAALSDAFAPSTAASRGSATVAWERYLQVIGFVPAGGLWSSVALMAMEALIIGFICFEVAVRGLSPVSVCTVYLPHVANSFAVSNVSCLFQQASRQQRVRLVSRGFLNRYNRANPKCERAKAVFSLDMTEGAFWVRTGVLASLCYTAMRFGIFFLLRKGEFLRTRAASGIRRGCVQFFTEEQLRIPYSLVGTGEFPAHSMKIKVTFSKTDQSGYGRLLEHVRQKEKGGGCIVSEIESYVAFTRDQWGVGEDDCLFTDGSGAPLMADVVAACMKDIAAVLGMDTTKVSAHSLRYGGASLLASFGLPQYIIAYYGGWKEGSDSLRLYARPSAGSMSIVSECFARARADGEMAARIAVTFGRAPGAKGEAWVPM